MGEICIFLDKITYITNRESPYLLGRLGKYEAELSAQKIWPRQVCVTA